MVQKDEFHLRPCEQALIKVDETKAALQETGQMKNPSNSCFRIHEGSPQQAPHVWFGSFTPDALPNLSVAGTDPATFYFLS